MRAFSNSDDFALTGLVVTQQVGENPWHYCPSPQFVVTLEGSWYIRTSDGKTTTFRPGDVLYRSCVELRRPSRTSTPSIGRTHGNTVASMAWSLDAVEETR